MLNALRAGKRATEALAACSRGIILTSSGSACNLLTDAEGLVSLVLDTLGEGPLNITVEADAFPMIGRGSRFAVADGLLSAGPLRMNLNRAVRWNGVLSAPLLAGARRRMAAEPGILSGSLAEANVILVRSGCAPILNERAASVTRALTGFDEGALVHSVTVLLGLGPGLTPAGDDWLAGWLLGLWVVDAHAARCAGRVILRAAAGRTTRLSRAYLECAATGEVDAAWLDLLTALAEGSSGAYEGDSSLDTRRYGDVTGNPLRMTSQALSAVGAPDRSLRAATRRLLARGATSGAAMFLGFATAVRVPASEENA